MGLEELYKKYHVLSDGLQRRYIINTNERRYDLEYATPIELHICVNREWENPNDESILITTNPKYHVFMSRSWVQLLRTLATYLQDKAPKTIDELVDYRTEWSKAPIFSRTKTIDNMVEISEGLYFSVNYTAVHSTWIIGDLLNFYGVGFGVLVIHKTPKYEPKEITDEIDSLRRKEFKEYLMND